MIDRDQAERLLESEAHLFNRFGHDAGQVLRIYVDEYTGWPSFATIASHQPGRETLVALHEAEPHNPDGIDTDGIDTDGIDTDGVDPDGIDTDGIDTDGIDTDGIDTDGIDTDGIDTDDGNDSAAEARRSAPTDEDLAGRGVRVPYDQARIDQAPTVGLDHDLSISEEDALFEYYEVPIDGVTPVIEHLGGELVSHETNPDKAGPVGR